MTKTVTIEFLGIDFEVEVEYEDNSVCSVESVSIDGRRIKCNVKEFFDGLESELQTAFENAIKDDEAAKADMMYDAAKEEGLLK